MEEGILYANVDLKQIPASKWILDVAGNYARPDIFRFTVNRKVNAIMQIEDSRVDCQHVPRKRKQASALQRRPHATTTPMPGVVNDETPL